MKRTSNAFTMAEILISLTIIGVIAALTLPALMANLNEKVWNTQRKALHSRMAQALAAMPRLDGYNETADGSAGYNFVLNGLTTALNITKVCENDRMDKCDFNYPQYSISDEALSLGVVNTRKTDTSWVSFMTVNGESIGIEYYNPKCTGSSSSDILSTNNAENMICATLVYDLNGASKGPNKMGKDMGFITAYFPEYPMVVAPMAVASTTSMVSADEVERLLSENPDYRLPSPAETVALAVNNSFINSIYGSAKDGVSFWTDNDVICGIEKCSKATIGGNLKENAKELNLKEQLKTDSEKEIIYEGLNFNEQLKDSEKETTYKEPNFNEQIKIDSEKEIASKDSATSAYLVLVSKNGDGPRTFKTLDSKDDGILEEPDTSTQKGCEAAGGVWWTNKDGTHNCIFKLK